PSYQLDYSVRIRLIDLSQCRVVLQELIPFHHTLSSYTLTDFQKNNQWKEIPFRYSPIGIAYAKDMKSIMRHASKYLSH
ncbi:MAG: hypothetical protein VXZ72_02055, partial [Chlamydiota bacterium]|nr:hypothetical protein [Chlamydiota bacterium]